MNPRATLAVATIALISACRKDTKPEVRLAAASDLTAAMADLTVAFEQSTGFTLKTTLGASGQLAEQLRQGAPFDAFASANLAFALRACDTDACDANTRFTYAKGRIALVAHNGKPPPSVRELRDARYKKIAIANPEHAPYGRAARETIESAGLWEMLKEKLVFAENTQQTLQWVDRGDADVGIVPDSLVGTRPRALVPSNTYKPLEQTFVMCPSRKNTAGAKALHQFMKSEQARAILSQHGFDLP